MSVYSWPQKKTWNLFRRLFGVGFRFSSFQPVSKHSADTGAYFSETTCCGLRRQGGEVDCCCHALDVSWLLTPGNQNSCYRTFYWESFTTAASHHAPLLLGCYQELSLNSDRSSPTLLFPTKSADLLVPVGTDCMMMQINGPQRGDISLWRCVTTADETFDRKQREEEEKGQSLIERMEWERGVGGKKKNVQFVSIRNESENANGYRLKERIVLQEVV